MTMLASDRPDTRLQPDRDEAERIVAALDPDADRFTFQTFDDDRERRDLRTSNSMEVTAISKFYPM